MKPSLSYKIQPHLTITPKLQQAIRLLHLSSEELASEIQSLLETNPFLEGDPLDLFEKTSVSFEHNTDLDRFYLERRSEAMERSETGMTTQTASRWRAQDALVHTSHPMTLQETLLWQMELAHFTALERLIARTLIDTISEEGYLGCSLEEIRDSLLVQGCSMIEFSEIEAVLHRIQQFEPLGVGAGNLSECLSIQLNALPLSTPFLNETKSLATHHLTLLAARDFTRLKAILRLTDPELKIAIKTLMQLNPKPGRSQHFYSKTDCIIPDLIVRKKNGHFVVKYNMKTIPKLRIHSEYAHLLTSATAQTITSPLRQYFSEAKWLLKSLKNRQITLMKVAHCILESQSLFLEKGAAFMQPLILKDIALKTHLHESTVSRIISQKYIDTPQGVFELKSLLSNPIHSCASTAIRAHIKHLITRESQQNPLSDDAIAKLLTEQAIPITRRTVTKYRESLNIPSSYKRRHLSFNLK